MPASLVDSQFAALEPPEGESDVVTMAADAELPGAAVEVARRVGGGRAAP
jgi:gluconate kinase